MAEARAHLAQRLGHLQPEPARTARDQRHAPVEVEQLLDVHVVGS
jgi:hypothetical protein